MITVAALGLFVVCAGLALARNRRGDLLSASRAVSPWWNASAISGEYISAAGFLGTAGLVLAYGVDMLWLPIGASAGYVVLLALVIAPLRRSGAYTLSDFAEWRLGSRRVRRAVSTCVVFTGWFYLLPQFQGAGVTLSAVTGLPMWTGWAAVTVAAAVLVLGGGMSGITCLQAVQFWLKLVAVVVPALVLAGIWRLHSTGAGPPRFHRPTVVTVTTDVHIHVVTPAQITVSGLLDGRPYHAGHVLLADGGHRVRAGARLAFPAGAAVPHAGRLTPLRADRWATPFASGRDHPLAATYSLLLAMLLGAMGLPHVVVRFYSNAGGVAARRTAGIVVGLLALFYCFPALFGALGRMYAPELLLTGDTDATMLVLPHRMLPGLGGDLLTALVTTGAFAAFTATTCGVVVAVSGTISQCMLGGGRGAFRLGALISVVVPLLLVPWVGALASAALVTPAFAISAATLGPLLVLGVWWRGLTAAGAGAGLVTGAVLTVGAGLAQILAGPWRGWPGTFIDEPALLAVPIAASVMVVGSLLTAGQVPRDAARVLARLHLPEELVLDRSR